MDPHERACRGGVDPACTGGDHHPGGVGGLWLSPIARCAADGGSAWRHPGAPASDWRSSGHENGDGAHHAGYRHRSSPSRYTRLW